MPGPPPSERGGGRLIAGAGGCYSRCNNSPPGWVMHRQLLAILLGMGLAGLGAGCIDDLDDECRTDEDCGPGARCVDQGVRVCLEDGTGGDGGTGGTAGTGGEGGEGGGGAGGTGGDGGSIAEPVVVPVQVEVWADEAYGRLQRPVAELVLRVTGAGEPIEQRLRHEAGGWLLAGEGAGEPVELSVEVEIPGEGTTTLALEVTAQGPDATGELQPLAIGTRTLEADPAGAENRASVTVAFLDTFDFDGDRVGDLADCAPDDPAIHPGAIDLCDGVDNDCNPGGACHVPVPEGQRVVDLACGAGTCLALLDGDQTPGSLWEVTAGGIERRMELAGVSQVGEEPVPLEQPLGLALGSTGSRRMAFATDAIANRIWAFPLDGTGPSVEVVVPTGTVSGAMTASSSGNLLFSPLLDQAAGDLILPPSEPPAEGFSRVNCGREGSCKLVDLQELTDGVKRLTSGALVRASAIRSPTSAGNLQLYSVFEGDNRLGIAVVSRSTGAVQMNISGLVSLWEDGSPTSLALRPADEDVLYVLGTTGFNGVELAALKTGNDLEAHTPITFHPLPLDTAPIAIASGARRLFVTAAGGTLLAVPLTEDRLPAEAETTAVTIRGCDKPTRLVARTVGEVDQAILACEGEAGGAATIVLTGAD